RDIVTGKAARDKAMHEWQNTESFPDGEFALSSLQPSSGSDFTALGRLTLHGVTRDIHFPVSISRDGALLEITGDATVDTREFGLPVIRMLGILKVNPLVHVRIHLKGTPTESGGTRQ